MQRRHHRAERQLWRCSPRATQDLGRLAMSHTTSGARPWLRNGPLPCRLASFLVFPVASTLGLSLGEISLHFEDLTVDESRTLTSRENGGHGGGGQQPNLDSVFGCPIGRPRCRCGGHGQSRVAPCPGFALLTYVTSLVLFALQWACGVVESCTGRQQTPRRRCSSASLAELLALKLQSMHDRIMIDSP